MRQWGYIRETAEAARKAGISPDTGVCRTGLDEYLAVIYPNTKDWVHDEPIGITINGKISRIRPDYRSDSLHMIVEFDGLQHYTNPANVRKDKEHTSLFESLGYRVVRIPYFIQLTNEAVKTLFGVEVDEPLFDPTVPSMGIKSQNTPAYLCYSGLQRMAKEFLLFPTQYEVCITNLRNLDDQFLAGTELLEHAVKIASDK